MTILLRAEVTQGSSEYTHLPHPIRGYSRQMSEIRCLVTTG